MTVEPRTHLAISRRLCGEPLTAEPQPEGRAAAVLTTVAEMAVDDWGLVHGGFVFGLADYAAMLAVNDPNVVLGSADVRFLAPVRVGERLVAEAQCAEVVGRKSLVRVEVRRDSEAGRGAVVLSGALTCFTLDRHVLSPAVPQ